MKTALGKVTGAATCGKAYSFKCENGNLNVSVLSQDIALFEYRINGFPVQKALEDASSSLYTLPGCFEKSCLSENSDSYSIECGRLQIKVARSNADVTVLRDGIICHGGHSGGSDTVIPQSQFRLVGAGDYRKGKLNFPLGKDDRFFGLGDKAGSPDHRGKRLRMYNRDSLGYDPKNSDPLYKSVPFIIRQNPSSGTLAGLFFPCTCIDAFDLGKESPFYWNVDMDYGPFSYFVILGDGYKEIVHNYCTLTGNPALPPLYSFGYLGSSMNYVEAWDAQQRIERFFQDVESHDLPCEGLYVSSGYLKSDEGYRHAFMWNRRKFPDPGSFIAELEKRGYHLTFNIKPGILKTHPLYSELAEKGYFVKDSEGRPLVEFYWGGEASFIDFLNPDAASWWKGMLKTAYLDYGAEGIWNDNNEFEMEDTSCESFRLRTVYPVEMSKLSYEAISEKNPKSRPWIYSRSGYSGIQKYARTWTGDNSSTFDCLKFNQFQGLSMGLCGIPFVGHDLGGFFGPEPSEELLVRSAQSAVFQSRFVIHSWRESDEPTEPWKFQKAFGMIRAAIEEHYRHMPYIYNEAYQSSEGKLSGAPLERLICLEYPNDASLSPDLEESMFGSSILKAPVVNEGQKSKEVVFPEGDNWYSPRLGTAFKGGTTVDLDAPIDTFWYFYKVGSIIPKTSEVKRLSTGFFSSLELFVLPRDGNFGFDYFEDDGISRITDESHNEWRFEVSYSRSTGKGSVKVSCMHLGDPCSLEGRTLSIALPAGFECSESELDMVSADGAVVKFSGKYL